MSTISSLDPTAEPSISCMDSASGLPRSSRLAYLSFCIVFLLVLLLSQRVLAWLDLPTYGVWTGNVPLESKLKKLQDFSQAGPVDAVVMGSSLADNGFSAETFSAELSRIEGRPIRVFNMATGAGDWQIFPILYRLTKLYANPKRVYLFHPGSSGTGNEHRRTGKWWPDAQFMESNAGKFFESEKLFSISEKFWMSPLINAGGAVRDLALYGRYARIPSSSLLVYPQNSHGDKISHMFMRSDTEVMKYRAGRMSQMIANAAAYLDPAVSHDCVDNNPFFSRDDLRAVRHLKAMLEVDDVELVLVVHEPAASYGNQSEAYQNALTVFATQAAQTCLQPHKVVHPLRLTPFDYEVEDILHLNVHGARRTALVVASQLARLDMPPPVQHSFYLPNQYPTGAEFHHLLGVILSDATAKKQLKISYYIFNVAPVDRAAMRAATRLELELLDGAGQVHFGKATASDGENIVFSFAAALPDEPTAFTSRLVEVYPDGGRHYLVAPVEKYYWID